MCPTTGTYSREHLLRCLARSVNARPGVENRRRFLRKFGKNNPRVVETLKRYMREEWRATNAGALPPGGATASGQNERSVPPPPGDLAHSQQSHGL